MNPKVIILDERKWNEFSDEVFAKREFKNEAEEEDYRNETFRIQNLVRKHLGKKWKYPEDWEVGYDWNHYNHYYNCGGIYSDKAFCWNYIKQILKAFRSAKHPELTSYHTVCEIIENPDTEEEEIDFRGEFYVTPVRILIKKGMAKQHIEQLTDKNEESTFRRIGKAARLKW